MSGSCRPLLDLLNPGHPVEIPARESAFCWCQPTEAALPEFAQQAQRVATQLPAGRDCVCHRDSCAPVFDPLRFYGDTRRFGACAGASGHTVALHFRRQRR